MKNPSQSSFTAIVLGITFFMLLLMPVPVQAAKDPGKRDASQFNVGSDFLLHCPAGVEHSCVPHLVGTVVLCTEGDEVKGYSSISDYCLSCHTSSQPMIFEHPYEVDYPVYREEFRSPSSLHESIELDAGDLTCKTCHSGVETENHFLAENYDSDRICGHCHMTGIECPGEDADLQSVCFPGRLNGDVRCVSGEDVIIHLSTSKFCSNCHGGVSRFHSVDVEYPLNRSGFNAVDDLDPKIKLEDGYVTCESCHAKKNEGMMLCNSCHPK
jgi:hypothetical protein